MTTEGYVEASAFPAPPSLARTRISIGAPLLRLRSDEQLVQSFREGSNEAFRVIHDRYRKRLFAYTRQMLPGSRQDAEDALQDVFIRAFGGLRASDRELALRPWLYRIAHNRCVDELRRPVLPTPELMELVRSPVNDPIAEAEHRESLRRLIADVRRLPKQQRSALLMRELAGMSYAEIADALAVSVPAVKSLLVRSRIGLAQSAEARDASCAQIQEDLILAHDRGVRAPGMARRHLRDCPGCREFRGHLRGTSRQFSAFFPALGPAGIAAKLLGFSGGASGGAAAAGGTGGTVATTGIFAAGTGHVATILAAAVMTAGGAVEIQHTIAPLAHPTPHHRTAAHRAAPVMIGDGSPRTAAVPSGPAPPPEIRIPSQIPAQPAENAEAPPTSSTVAGAKTKPGPPDAPGGARPAGTTDQTGSQGATAGGSVDSTNPGASSTSTTTSTGPDGSAAAGTTASSTDTSSTTSSASTTEPSTTATSGTSGGATGSTAQPGGSTVTGTSTS